MHQQFIKNVTGVNFSKEKQTQIEMCGIFQMVGVADLHPVINNILKKKPLQQNLIRDLVPQSDFSKKVFLQHFCQEEEKEEIQRGVHVKAAQRRGTTRSLQTLILSWNRPEKVLLYIFHHSSVPL